jgi:hypothetical protein
MSNHDIPANDTRTHDWPERNACGEVVRVPFFPGLLSSASVCGETKLTMTCLSWIVLERDTKLSQHVVQQTSARACGRDRRGRRGHALAVKLVLGLSRGLGIVILDERVTL